MNPTYVIFDIDGCIADDRHRRPLIKTDPDLDPDERYAAYHAQCWADQPMNTDVVDAAIRAGHTLLFITARPETEVVERETRNWLAKHLVPNGTIYVDMRPTDNHWHAPLLKGALLANTLHGLGIDINQIVSAYDDRLDVLRVYSAMGVQRCIQLDHNGVGEDFVQAAAPAHHEEAERCATHATAPSVPVLSVDEILQRAAATYRERNEAYGNQHQRFGSVIGSFFPNGVRLNSHEEFGRFADFTFCVAKLSRYSVNMESGGHKDSAHDLINFAAFLEQNSK